MRILMFAVGYYPPTIGGAQRLTHRVTQHLHLEGHTVRVLAVQQPAGEEFDRAQPFSTSRALYIVPDGASRWDKVRHKWDTLQTVRAEILEFRPDVILCPHWDPCGYVSWLTKLVVRHVPYFVIGHGTELAHLPARGASLTAKKLLRRLAFYGCSAAIANSYYTKKVLQRLGIPGEKVVVITPGIDVSDIPNASRRQREITTDPMLVTVCRLVPRKGVDTVILALPSLVKRYPNLRYYVVGDGPRKPYLESVAKEQNVEEHVIFEGEVSESRKNELLSMSDLFLMPARQTATDYEGFGIVYLEAMAHSVPVIGSATGGIPDAVENEVTGLLIPPDDPSAVAAAAHRLLSDTNLRQRLVDEAIKRLELKFSWRVIAQQYAAHMNQYVKQKAHYV